MQSMYYAGSSPSEPRFRGTALAKTAGVSSECGAHSRHVFLLLMASALKPGGCLAILEEQRISKAAQFRAGILPVGR
jgi:hypothetical protein